MNEIFGVLFRKLSLIVTLGKIESKSKDGLKIKLDSGESVSDIPYFQHYGFSSSPPKGSGIICVANADRQSLKAIGSRGKEPELKEGETALYAGDKAKIILSPDGKIKMEVASKNILREIIESLTTMTQGKTADGKPFVFDPLLTTKLQELKKIVE